MASSILDDGEYYKKRVEEFLKKTNEEEKDKEILKLYLPDVVREILQGHQRSQFNILSIGCGDGKMDRWIVKVIKEELQRHEKYKNTKIFTRAIDPNDQSVSEYKDALKSCEDGSSVFSVLHKTFQEYRQEQLMSKTKPEEKVKFDMVHFIHSIYHVDPEEALVYCFENELHENGKVVCITEGRDMIYSSAVAMSIPVKQVRKLGPYESYTEELKHIAEKRGLKVDVHMQEYSLDVTEVFDEKSKEGNLLLDFMTQVKNFRAVSDEKVEEILKLIKESSQVMENGKRLGKRKDGIIFISK